jgi:catechol 2,3-dioxygenase-like lactoylglutathione lyase family enzyme
MEMRRAMRGSILAVTAAVALAFPTLSTHAQGLTSGLTGRTIGVHRTTLIVEDIDKSVDFYQRIGLTKVSDATGTDSQTDGIYGAADLPLTADPKRSRAVTLKGSEANGMLLVLVSYDRPPLPSARGNLVGIGTGDVIIGIEVPDIQFAYGRLNQIGTRFHRQPVRFAQTGEGAISGQHMLAYDPDGHMVEVIQPDRTSVKP